MLIFNNTVDVIPTLRREIEVYGEYVDNDQVNAVKTTKKCKELLGVSFQIIDWSDRDETLRKNELNKLFCDRDVEDRLSPFPVNPGTAIKFDTAGVLKPYINKDTGRLRYTYSERLWYQIDNIIRLLRDKPGTRQAFMAVWDPKEDVAVLERERVPCSIGYHFLIRGNKLIMLYSMRSLEVDKCLGNDMYTASKMLEYIADQVGVEPGYIQFNVGSLHIFEEV
jgi:thymidylate synthase